jgi:cystathionine beta-lyase
MQKDVPKDRVMKFVNSLKLFKIGYSWGGVTSLAVAYDFSYYKNRPSYQHRIVRLNIGLEAMDDLLADLQQAFQASAG